jgi:chromosomal replication initiator protein
MKAIWEEIKTQIRSELPKNSFSLWISPITFLEQKDKTIILGCPNKFSRKWVIENYLSLIQDKFVKSCTTPFDLIFKEESAKSKEVTHCHYNPHPDQLTLPNVNRNGNSGKFRLNKDFTFDRFIVGRSNEFAYTASNALANEAPCHYQSLFMLGDTGLGKTHLAQAIGHAILQQNPQSRICYTTAENFTNEMIFSLRNNRIEEFKNKYRRSCDALLLEEIHFLSGKEKTQTELGYTLDALANDNKKIIFTSFLPPKDIPRMSRELSSRLTSSLVTTIGGPDYDTRVKIFAKKAFDHGILLPEEIIHHLAARLKRDVRQMESALTYLKAKSELLKANIDLDLAKEVVNCFVSREYSITPDDISKLVCKYFKVEPQMLASRSRKKLHVLPRNIYVYLCRRHTDHTLENIAKTINRSHSAALHSSELVESKIKTDHRMRYQVNFLSQKLDDMKQ